MSVASSLAYVARALEGLPGLQVCREEGHVLDVFSTFLRASCNRKLPASERRVALNVAAREAEGLERPFALPGLILALQVLASIMCSLIQAHLQVMLACQLPSASLPQEQL